MLPILCAAHENTHRVCSTNSETITCNRNGSILRKEAQTVHK